MQSHLTHVLLYVIINYSLCISITSILATQVLLKSGDIEKNPGPKKSFAIKFFHGNLNGLAAHDYKPIGTHWIAFYVSNNNVTYFDIFGGEHIPKETKKFIGNKNIITNIYRIQAYNSIMCVYFARLHKFIFS